MRSFVYRIRDAHGIHARPAGTLAKIAQEYDNTVMTIEKGKKSARLDRVLMLMGLGVREGDEVTVTAEGEHEEQACRRLEEYFRENL